MAFTGTESGIFSTKAKWVSFAHLNMQYGCSGKRISNPDQL